MSKPPFKTKLFFWFILGAFSIVFAEVIAGSQMFAFFTPLLILLYLVYGLHAVVLWYVVSNYGKLRLYPIYIAGMIFGLYEAYLTKVLWYSYGHVGAPVILGGVGVLEFITLVLFWHAVLAFMLPIIVSETILTKSRESLEGVPDRLKRLFVKGRGGILFFVLFAILAGYFQSNNSPSVIHSLASGIGNGAVLLFLCYLWRRKHKNKYEMRDLLPTKKQFRYLLIMILVSYPFFLLIFKEITLPPISSQLTIWLAYTVFFIMLYYSLKKSKKFKFTKTPKPTFKFSYKFFIFIALLFTFTSAFFAALPGNIITKWAIALIPVTIIGFTLFVSSLKDLFKKK
jgi:hypothetical protein